MANSSSEERRDEPAKEIVYKTKQIQFFGRTTPIILQNDNGPCPLLAICNVLLLRNKLSLSSDVAEVSQKKILSLVEERLIAMLMLIDSNSNVNNKDAGYVENQQQNIADAIDMLPRLTTGIDVNIRFREISDFEFTRECVIFDLLDIPLYHGWIVDPQDSDTANAIGVKSYNILSELVALETQVDRGSSSADGTRPKDGISPREGELIKNFLRSSASQLTIYGLFCLQDGLKERELCVFFWNNHFNTMFKIGGELYLLVTDQGYINQTDLVWEKLNEVNGDTLFMTGNFEEFKVENPETSSWDEQNAMPNTADYRASMDSSAQANTNFNSDLQVAIALQQQEFEQQPQSQRNAPQSNVSGGLRLGTGPPQDYLASMDSSAQANTNFNSDLQLAIALQQQEFEQQPQSQRNAPQSNVSGGSRLFTGPPQGNREAHGCWAGVVCWLRGSLGWAWRDRINPQQI